MIRLNIYCNVTIRLNYFQCLSIILFERRQFIDVIAGIGPCYVFYSYLLLERMFATAERHK